MTRNSAVKTTTTTTARAASAAPIIVSLGIMAWNEEASIVRTLESLFRQSVFQRLALRRKRLEILCLPNGCSDRTAEVSRNYLAHMQREHPYASTFQAEVIEIEQPGRNNAWNRFVHEFSAREAKFIFLMDADIILRHPDTIFNMFATLEENTHAQVTSSRGLKDIQFKEWKTPREWLSLGTSAMTGTIAGGFSGQLYCMRAEAARNLYLPRDLGANDDGFFKAVICTECFEHGIDHSRIVRATDASHIYEAYVSVTEILNNQKRQMIGQTAVYVLVEFLRQLPREERLEMAATLQRLEQDDPDWLKKLLDRHLAGTRHFWEIFPGILTFRFKRLLRLPGLSKLTHFPAAFAGFVVTMIACHRACRFLKQGQTYYWPRPSRPVTGIPAEVK